MFLSECSDSTLCLLRQRPYFGYGSSIPQVATPRRADGRIDKTRANNNQSSVWMIIVSDLTPRLG